MKEAKEAPAYTVKGGLIMKYFIYALADRHGFDITGEGDGPRSMRLTLEPYPLFVEHVGKNLIAVGHRGTVDGQPICDPEMVFFTAHEAGWVPVTIKRPHNYSYTCTSLTEDGEKIDRFNPWGQADLTAQSWTWADSLRAQGWLDRSVRQDESSGG